VRTLLEARGVEVVAEARNGREAQDMTRRLQPDIVLMDLAMPEVGGLDAIRAISVESPEARVVVLTASEEDADLFEAIKSGAQGYLLKDLKADDLMALLEGVSEGQPAFTPSLARKVLTEFARPPTQASRSADDLTEREHDVLELLVQGITSNHDLADKLIVTENTVKYHLRNILGKLHLKNRAQVVAYAMQHGLVNPPKERS